MSENISENVLNDYIERDIKEDKCFRRILITWNNPYWENQFEEVDITNTDLKLNLEKYDLKYFKDDFNKDYFDFKYIKYKNSKTNEDEVVERPFFKNANSIINYISNLVNFRFCSFQIEKGGNSELTHIQGFVCFKKPIHFYTLCNRFPVANFEQCRGSNTQCREYTTKFDTRVDGPYEFGDFAEERSRTDIKEFLELVDSGATNKELKQMFPSLYLREFKKIDNLRSAELFDEYKKKKRDVEVTYVYGPAGVGKTTYVYDFVGFEDTYAVDQFDNSAFTHYLGESNLVIDEFNCQFRLLYMNKLLDKIPLKLRALNQLNWACYTKVYIISNLAPKDLYKEEQETNPVLFKAFMRRLHNIIRFDSFGKIHYEKKREHEEQVELEELTDNDNLEF